MKKQIHMADISEYTDRSVDMSISLIHGQDVGSENTLASLFFRVKCAMAYRLK